MSSSIQTVMEYHSAFPQITSAFSLNYMLQPVNKHLIVTNTVIVQPIFSAESARTGPTIMSTETQTLLHK